MAAAPPPPFKVAAGLASYASVVQSRPQPIPEVDIEMRSPNEKDGETWFHFTRGELERATTPFKCSVVLKFLKRRPSLDQIRSFIKSRWGLKGAFSVSKMQRPRNVFIRLTTEEDFGIACARESTEIEGSPYRLFIWSPDFDEDQESSLVPVWLFLPGLPPHYYHESILRVIGGACGRFLKRDNFTACATRTDGARICVEMDISKPPRQSFWLGSPFHPSSRCQVIIYETLPMFCHICRTQGHSDENCRTRRTGDKAKTFETERTKLEGSGKTWRKKEGKQEAVLAPATKAAESERKKVKRHDLLLKCGRVIQSDPVMFADSFGFVYDAVEVMDVCENVTSQCKEIHSAGEYMDSGNYCEPILFSGIVNREVEISNQSKHFEKNGISKDTTLEQAILRGDIDAIHDTIVMQEMDRIADVVMREDDPTDAYQIENRMGPFGQDMEHFLETDDMENEMGVGPYHTRSEGASGDDLPEFEFLNYETEYENFVPARKRRGNNRKKVVLGITTRSKKFY